MARVLIAVGKLGPWKAEPVQQPPKLDTDVLHRSAPALVSA